jgi:hypothetical protein
MVPGGTPPGKKSRASAGRIFASVELVKLVPLAPAVLVKVPPIEGAPILTSSRFQSEVFMVKLAQQQWL